MNVTFGPGFHARPGSAVDVDAYFRYVGRWSALFVPAVLEAAHLEVGSRVLDVASGPGEASIGALSIVGPAGLVVGVDIAPSMLVGARSRSGGQGLQFVAADGQALPFREGSFDAVVCQLGLQFFSDPESGIKEFRRVLRTGGRAATCVISTPDRAPMWGVLADTVSRYLPDQRNELHLSFALAEPDRLERSFWSAGFRDVRVERAVRESVTESFDEYWSPIEAGVGQLPQAYLALPKSTRVAVRDEVRTRLLQFESQGRLVMGVEMLIASGRA